MTSTIRAHRHDVHVHARLAEIDAEEWDALTARPPASVCGSRAWVVAAFATVDRNAEPYLIAVKVDGRVVALLPLAARQVNSDRAMIASFAAAPHNDMTDLMVLPGYEETASATVLEALATVPRAWAVDLDELDPEGVLATADRKRRILGWDRSDPAPAIDLRRPWAERVSARRGKRWDRELRRLQAGHSIDVRCVEGAQAVAALPWFVRCREARLKAKERPLDLPPIPLLEAVVQRLAPAGRCAFIELLIDGEPAAADLYLLDGRVAMAWLRALDGRWHKFSCGHLLMRASGELLAARGYDTLDLGRGDEPYKFAFGARARTLLRAGRPATAAV